MIQKPQSGKDVWPGQDWRFPDGETIHVGAIMYDGCERTALCTTDDGGVYHLPAQMLVNMAEFIKGDG